MKNIFLALVTLFGVQTASNGYYIFEYNGQNLLASHSTVVTLAQTSGDYPPVECPPGSTMDIDCLREKRKSYDAVVNLLNRSFSSQMRNLRDSYNSTLQSECDGDTSSQCAQDLRDAYAMLALQATENHENNLNNAASDYSDAVLEDCCIEGTGGSGQGG